MYGILLPLLVLGVLVPPQVEPPTSPTHPVAPIPPAPPPTVAPPAPSPVLRQYLIYPRHSGRVQHPTYHEPVPGESLHDPYAPLTNPID